MTVPTLHTTNDENASPATAAPLTTPNTINRRVLSDVSPNVKVAPPTVGMLNTKPTTSSPLKRSFTSVMEDGAGFTYLKKRRVSVERPLGYVDRSAEPCGSSASLEEESVRFRPMGLPEPTRTDNPPMPTVSGPSPTEPNTPSDSGEGTQGSSIERKSFSSLINYDPSSQTMSNLVFKHPSRAEMLKLRLRVAMYKVRTNQVDVPFDRLHVEGERDKRKTTSEAVEEAVAQLKREAQEEESISHADQAFPKLLPAPVLTPTAYSSRMIYEQVLPSSPPASKLLENNSQLRQFATPAHQPMRQLSSPPDSAGRQAELASNAVKGRVAEGLLGLRNAA